MKRYIFFLRAYNDTDNIAPAIHFLLDSADDITAEAIVYSRDFAFQGDENLEHLRSTFPDRFNVSWLWETMGVNYDLHFNRGRIGNLVARLIGRISGQEPNRFMCNIGRMSPQTRAAIAAKVLGDGPKPRAVFFDQNRSHQVIGAVQQLRRQGIGPIVALPVSPFINISTLRSTDMATIRRDALRKKHDYDAFDTVAQTDRFYSESLEATYSLLGLPSPLKDKVRVLGSIRYCPEWLAIRESFREPLPKEGSRTKLVFFLSNPKTNVFWDEVVRTVRFLAEFPNIDVVVKPHTRRMQFDFAADAPNITIDSSTTSSALIEWADCALVWGSSIALEAYMKKKTVLVLDLWAALISS